MISDFLLGILWVLEPECDHLTVILGFCLAQTSGLGYPTQLPESAHVLTWFDLLISHPYLHDQVHYSWWMRCLYVVMNLNKPVRVSFIRVWGVSGKLIDEPQSSSWFFEITFFSSTTSPSPHHSDISLKPYPCLINVLSYLVIPRPELSLYHDQGQPFDLRLSSQRTSELNHDCVLFWSDDTLQSGTYHISTTDQ